MIAKLIRCLVAALVLYLLYICAGLIVAAIAAPAVVLTIVAVILASVPGTFYPARVWRCVALT